MYKLLFILLIVILNLKFNIKSTFASEQWQYNNDIRIFSYIDDFIEFWEEAQDLGFEEKILKWDQIYESENTELIQRFVCPLQNKRACLKRAFGLYPRFINNIYLHHASSRNVIKQTLNSFSAFFDDLDVSVDIYIIVGRVRGFGFASSFEGRPAIIMQVEFPSTSNALSVVLAHELAHMYHFQKSAVIQRRNLGNTLFVEGFATFASSKIIPRLEENFYFWWGYRTSDQNYQFQVDHFLELCQERKAQLIDRIFPYLSGNDYTIWQEYFSGGMIGDLVPPRAGYWLGWKVIEYLWQGTSLNDLATWSTEKVNIQVSQVLQNFATWSDF